MSTDLRDVNWFHLATVAIVSLPFFFAGRYLSSEYYLGVFQSFPGGWEIRFLAHFFIFGIMALIFTSIENRLIWYRVFAVHDADISYSWPSPIALGSVVGFLSPFV